MRAALLALVLLVAFAYGDEWSFANAFGQQFLLASGWSGLCNTTCSITTGACCNWPGVTTGPDGSGGGTILKFEPVPPPGHTLGQAWPADVWNVALGSIPHLSVFSLANWGFTALDTSAFAGVAMYWLKDGNGTMRISGNQFNTAFEAILNSYLGIGVADLSYNGFSGTTPNYADTVTDINLSHNAFTSMSAFLTSSPPSSCTRLDVSYNQLSGALPANWPAAVQTELTYIDFSHNNFTYIPLDPDFGLTLLTYDISDNQIVGPLPLSTSPVLRTLDYSKNSFNGAIPSFFNTSFVALEHLHFYGNNLTGEFPLGPYSFASNMKTIYLYGNRLTGNLPELPGPTCPLLQALDFSNNKFSGTLAVASFSSACPNLISYRIAKNLVTGPIPTEIGLTSLEYIDLSANELSGPVPSELSQCNTLIELTLSHNTGLTGDIAFVQNLTNLATLRVQNCSFSGDLSFLVGRSFALCDVSLNNFNYNSCAGALCNGCPPPPTTRPPLVCADTTNCGPNPSQQVNGQCCDGVWVMFPNASKTAPKNVTIAPGCNVLWSGNWNHRPADLLTIALNSTFYRKRQNQDALLKVAGDAFINGPLSVVIDDTEISASLESTPIQVVGVLGADSNITGRFVEPITVSLPKKTCATGTAQQTVYATSIEVLVTVDDSNCSQDGLSLQQKIAIAVVCGVVGFLLIGLGAFFVVRKFAPRTAVKFRLKRSPTMTAGKKMASYNL